MKFSGCCSSPLIISVSRVTKIDFSPLFVFSCRLEKCWSLCFALLIKGVILTNDVVLVANVVIGAVAQLSIAAAAAESTLFVGGGNYLGCQIFPLCHAAN